MREAENPFAAERLTTWGKGVVRGAHASTGAAAPGYLWTFAEGTTQARIQSFYLLSNPGETPAHVAIDYLCAQAFPGTRRHTVPSRSRLTVWVNQEGSPLDAAECGAIVTSDQPIVAERSMYLLDNGQFTAGTSATGMSMTAVLGQTWYAPAGATVDPFDMFMTLVNPVPTAHCDAEVTYLLPDQTAISRVHRVDRRLTIWVDHEDPRLAQAGAVATRVHCPTGPIVVERAMWWRTPGSPTWTEGHVERGSPETATAWAMAYVPESATLSILNTAPSAGLVKVTLYATNGIGAAEATMALAPGLTVVLPIDLWPSLGPDRYSATVRSLESDGAPPVPLVVERTSYAPDLSVGTTSLGTPIP